MGRYSKIVSDMWSDREFDEELGIEGKLFYVYLLSNDAVNMAGFYRLNPKLASAETGIPYERVLAFLEKDISLWKWDKGTRQVLIKSYMKYNSVSNEKQYKGVAAQVKSLSFCPLFMDFMAGLVHYTKGLGLYFIEDYILLQTKKFCQEIIDGGQASTMREVRARVVLNNINTVLNSRTNTVTVTDTDTGVSVRYGYGMDTVSEGSVE